MAQYTLWNTLGGGAVAAPRSRNDDFALQILGQQRQPVASASGPAAEALPPPAQSQAMQAPPLDQRLLEMALQQAQQPQRSPGDVAREISRALPATTTTRSGPKKGNFVSTVTGRATYNGDPLSVFVETPQRQAPMLPQQNAGAVAALTSDVMRTQNNPNMLLGLLGAAQRQQEMQRETARQPMQDIADLATLYQGTGSPEINAMMQDRIDVMTDGRAGRQGLLDRIVPIDQRFQAELEDTQPSFRGIRDMLQPGQPNTRAQAKEVRAVIDKYRQMDLSPAERQQVELKLREMLANDPSLAEQLAR